MKIQLAQAADFADILALQARYHLSATATNQLAEGFVTTDLTLETLERMRVARALWIARADDDDESGNGGALAAYACAVEWDFYAGSDFVARVHASFPLPFGPDAIQSVTADNSFLYGPTCIDADFRGRGLLPALTAAIGARYAQTRAFGVCFIDVRNARSLAAHERKLGFSRLATLEWPDVTYNMLAFATAQTS